MNSKNNLVTVVLIDDDPDDIRFMEEAINNIESRIHFISFVDPIEGTRFLSVPGALIPDLIFIDINMPLKKGDECLSELREVSHLKDVPIVMYSTTMNAEMTQKLLEAGATATFQKPILAEEYQNLILDALIPGSKFR